MAEPFVSIRKHIKWGASFMERAANENTNTLVLTSSDKHYVDIRILGQSHPLPNNPSDPRAVTRLEWGFAGTAISTPAEYENGDKSVLVKPAHTQWVHEIDNKIRSPGPDDRDEGFMYPVEGTNEVLERGAMINPETGKVEDYEELWEDLEVRMREGKENESFISWVLKTKGHGGEQKGMVIRIGEWIQGVMRRGDEFSVARWEWSIGRGWERALAIGQDLALNSKIFEEGITVGDGFKAEGGVEWEFVSCHKHRK